MLACREPNENYLRGHLSRLFFRRLLDLSESVRVQEAENKGSKTHVYHMLHQPFSHAVERGFETLSGNGSVRRNGFVLGDR